MTALRYITAAANDGHLQSRVAAAAADLGEPDPIGWAADHRWAIATHGDIADVWEYTASTMTINHNQNIGQRTDAITDAMIVDAVTALRAADTEPA